MQRYVTGVWTLIIVSAVIGRIIDESNPDVEEDEPALTREQAKEWSDEFFGPSSYPGSSHLENFDELAVETSQREERRFDKKYPSARYENTLPPESAKPLVRIENLEWMLQNIFDYPRSYSSNETAREIAKKYIAESLEYTSGIPTTLQYFKPQQFLSLYDDGELPVGINIIGMLKGTTWSTAEDRVLVVGAHWDTVNFTPGTDDNGSGVAAMLEAARTMVHSLCKPKYTVIFVAFDLEETGSQGSLVFIKEYLVKILGTAGISRKTSLLNFQGAIIMDSLMNFNDTSGSQSFPTDWSLLLPDVYEEVANEDYKGDFLSVIYRNEVDNQLAKKFLHHWTKMGTESTNKFKIKPFPLQLGEELPELDILSSNLNFLRSDHARFWFMNDTEVPGTLKAVLITDTGPYRGNMRECYHAPCDGPEVSVYNNKLNLQFLAKATQVLTDTLMDMSVCEYSNRKTESTPNSIGYGITRRRGVKNNGANRRDSPFYNLLKLFKWLHPLY